MIRILKSKRGIAIESAILFMVILFSLSILLTGVVMSASISTRTSNKYTLSRIEYEQIGENFAAKAEGYIVPEGYMDADESPLILHLKRESSSATVLYIELDTEGNVVRWQYTAPQNNN